MKKYIVKDLMVPISEYASVPEDANLNQALMALENAQEAYQHSRYSHRAVLVLNKENRVIGKLSQMDFLQAMQPKDQNLKQIRKLKQFGFTGRAVALQQESYLNGAPPVEDNYARVDEMRVADYMQRTEEGEYVDENASLEMALHQLTTGSHLSLLVTRGKDIVGVLRLSDVFSAVSHTVKESESKGIDEAVT